MKASVTRVAVIVVAILLLPLIAMQFSNDIDWTLGDFAIMGLLLFVAGVIIELVIKKVTNPVNKVIASLVIIVVLLLVWAQLAVGLVAMSGSGS